MAWPPTTHQDVQDEVGTLRTARGQTEGIAVWTGSAWPARPTGFARIRWVGGATRPTAMAVGDVWEHDV